MKSTRLTVVLTALFFVFPSTGVNASDRTLVLTKTAGTLTATLSGQDTSFFFDYSAAGCGADKHAPCFVFRAVHMDDPIAVSAPADCDTSNPGEARCNATGYAAAALVQQTGGIVTLGGGTGHAPVCAPARVSVLDTSTGSVTSWDGCKNQRIECGKGSLVSVTANGTDVVVGPCQYVERKS